jgi:hypothetical protein
LVRRVDPESGRDWKWDVDYNKGAEGSFGGPVTTTAVLADAVQQNSVFGHLIGNREKEDRLREKLQQLNHAIEWDCVLLDEPAR